MIPPLPYTESEIDRQIRMAPLMLLRAVRSRRIEAVKFCLKSIDRAVETKSQYIESREMSSNG